MSAQVRNQLLADAITRSAHDPAFFCRFFLRKWFPMPMPPFHLGLLALFTRKVAWLSDPMYADAVPWLLEHFRYMSDPADPDSTQLPVFQETGDGRIRMVAGPNNAVIVPRGFSKTTLINAANIYDLATEPTTFCVYISESSAHSERQLGNIKKQFETNQLLVEAYGNPVPKRSESERWGADEIQLKNGAILIALGRGSQVRGLNYDARRPNKILLDDVEDKESVSTAAQRDKVSDWFYGDVVPAGNKMEIQVEGAQQELQITVLGTLLGADALLMKLHGDPTFNVVRFGAKLDDGGMLWPAKMSAPSYNFERERFRRQGKLAEFAREYDSVIRVDEDALFRFSDISLYIPTTRADLAAVAQALDPAISDQPGRDHSALITAGRRYDGVLWMLDEWGGLGKTPRELIDAFFENFIKWNCTHNGIEAQQYQKALIFLMREEMARKQKFFVVTPIVQGSKVSKDDRIAGVLQPRYANGYIKHQRRLPTLEAQLQDFPNGKKDYADAAAMALSLLGESGMLAAPADSPVTQDQYEPLPPAFTGLYTPGQTQIYTPSAADQRMKERYG
jgi:hypothetical protein